MWTVLFARLAWVHFQMGSTHEVFGWRAEHLCRKNKRSTGEEEAKLVFPEWGGGAVSRLASQRVRKTKMRTRGFQQLLQPEEASTSQ